MKSFNSKTIKIVVLAIFFVIICVKSYAQSARPYEIKSAYLINFINYFSWENNADLDSYTVGIVGDNVDIFTTLQNASASRFINGKPITIQQANSQEAMRSSHILYVSQLSDFTVQEISAITSGSNTLIVTDEQADKTHTMLNFIVNGNNTISFEINRPNIIFEKLEMNNDILLLGGTELDVAELFRSMEREVFSTKQRMAEIELETLKIEAEFSKQLEEQKKIVTTQENNIQQQANTIADNNAQLDEVKSELEVSREELNISKGQLLASNSRIQENLDELAEKNIQLNAQVGLVNENNLLLERQQLEIFEQEKTLDVQRQQVDQQSIVIESYLLWIQIGTAALFVFVILVSMILLINRKRTHANKLLAYQNIELKEAKLAFQRERDRADIANQAKSQFLANLSHEIRSPMNAILGFSELLELENANKDQMHFLDAIQRNGQHLLGLINDVLDMSKIEAGKVEIKHESFDLFHLLDDIDTMFRDQINEKGLKFSFKVGHDVPRYMASDEGKIRQILVNLLSNAEKFTKEGEVCIEILANAKEKQNKQGGNFWSVYFEVSDTGAGIENKDLEKIFEAFKQSETGKGAIQGTGLGLSISRNFARLLGGDIKVESQLGIGSTFCYELVAEVTSKLSEHKPISTGVIRGYKGKQEKYKVLIVDDKYENRELLLQILSPIGFLMEQAANGKEAVDTFEQWQPDLILMDLRMPVMDGGEVI